MHDYDLCELSSPFNLKAQDLCIEYGPHIHNTQPTGLEDAHYNSLDLLQSLSETTDDYRLIELHGIDVCLTDWTIKKTQWINTTELTNENSASKIEQTSWFKDFTQSATNLATMKNTLTVMMLCYAIYSAPYAAFAAIVVTTSIKFLETTSLAPVFKNTMDYYSIEYCSNIPVKEIAITIVWTHFAFKYNKYMFERFFSGESMLTKILLAAHVSISQNIISARVGNNLLHKGLEAFPKLANITSTASKRIVIAGLILAFGKPESFIKLLMLKLAGEVAQELHDELVNTSWNIQTSVYNVYNKTNGLIDKAVQTTINKEYIVPNWKTDTVSAQLLNPVRGFTNFVYSYLQRPETTLFFNDFMTILVSTHGVATLLV